MSVEDAFKMAQAIELVIANIAHIKNKNTNDMHEMFTAKLHSVEIQKRKKGFFGCNRE